MLVKQVLKIFEDKWTMDMIYPVFAQYAKTVYLYCGRSQ